MAERWLPVYDAFARKESWGDPDALRRSVDAVWSHALGRPLGAAYSRRHLALLHDITPHMDDFDAPEALAVGVMVHHAIDCCGPETTSSPRRRPISMCSRPSCPIGRSTPTSRSSLAPRARAEGGRPPARPAGSPGGGADARLHAAVAALRQELGGPGLRAELPRRKAPSAPALRTNQDIFEQYRAIIELDLRSRRDFTVPDATADLLAMLRFMEWVGSVQAAHGPRPLGAYGKLGDALVGQQALVLRQRARAMPFPSRAADGRRCARSSIGPSRTRR